MTDFDKWINLLNEFKIKFTTETHEDHKSIKLEVND